MTASAASAQQFAPLSADFIPDTASIGQPINFRIFNNSTQTWQTGACDWFTIYASDPATGLPDQSEAIDHTLICTLPPVTTPPGYILEWDWDQFDHCPNCGVTTPLPPYPQPTAVPAGTYWFHAHPNGLSEWFSFRIAADPNEPTIAPITPTRIGLNCTYTIKAPNAPGAVFGVLIAFSQNNPLGFIPSLGIDVHLAPPLFALGSGTLDASGSGSVSLSIPQRVSLIDEGFALQAILGTTNPFALSATNALAVSIRP